MPLFKRSFFFLSVLACTPTLYPLIIIFAFFLRSARVEGVKKPSPLFSNEKNKEKKHVNIGGRSLVLYYRC